MTGSVFVLTARSCRQASEESCMVKTEEICFEKERQQTYTNYKIFRDQVGICAAGF